MAKTTIAVLEALLKGHEEVCKLRQEQVDARLKRIERLIYVLIAGLLMNGGLSAKDLLGGL